MGTTKFELIDMFSSQERRMTLRQLLDSKHTRGHVKKKRLEVYIRTVPLYLEGQDRPAITIADFQMVDYTEDGLQAAFEGWFREAERLAVQYKRTLAFENAGEWAWMEKFLAIHHFTRTNAVNVHPNQLDAYRIYRETL